MKARWITVALFDNLPAAKAFEAFLKENRIHSRTYNEPLLQFFLFLCPPRDIFQVQVGHQIQKMTIDLLNSWPPAVLLKAIHCPECGSLRVVYPKLTRDSFWPTLCLNLGIIFRVIKHQAYCETCHHVWSLPKPGEVAGHDQPVPGHG